MKCNRILRTVIALVLVLSLAMSITLVPAGAATRTVKQVAANKYYAAAILSDGTLWTWGSFNAVTEKATNGTTIKLTDAIYEPVQISNGTDAKTVKLYENSAGFLKNDGTLWTWGSNGKGELGRNTGDLAYDLTPGKVEGLSGVRDFSLYETYPYGASLAVTNDNKLYIWAVDPSSKIFGEEKASYNSLAEPISTPTLIFEGAKHAAAFNDSIAVIDTNGKLWTWGANKKGECGVGNTKDQLTRVQPTGLENKTIVDVQMHSNRCAALTDTGELWVWGDNYNGKLGVGDDANDHFTPTKLDLPKITQFCLGGYTSFALDVSGQVWAWGDNNYGQLGQGTYYYPYENSDPTGITTELNRSPVRVTGKGGMPADAASLVTDGSGWNCMRKALMNNGDLWGWGDGSRILNGAVGPNKTAPNFAIKPLKMTDRVKSASVTDSAAFVIKDDETLWVIGGDQYGTAGVGEGYKYGVDEYTRIYFGDKPADTETSEGPDDSSYGNDTTGGAAGSDSQETSDLAVGATFKSKGNTFKVTAGNTVTFTKSSKKTGKVTIPSTVKKNGKTYKVTAIKASAFKGSNITKVTIGKNVKTIGKNAFMNCKKLKTVKLGANVKTIGQGAFSGCAKITSITIGAKVNKIGKKAFYNCKKLKTITIKTTKLTSAKVGASAFKGTLKSATVKVPSKKKTAYKKWLYKKGLNKKAKIK